MEEWFYFIFPVFLILAAHLRLPKYLALSVFLFILAVAKFLYANLADDPDNLRRITALRLDAITFGYIAYLISIRIRAVSKTQFAFLSVAAAALIAICCLAFLNRQELLFAYAAGLASALTIFVFRFASPIVSHHGILARLSGFLAHTSYSTYLVHLLVFQVQNQVVPLPPAIGFSMYCLAIIGISIISFYVVERPFQAVRPEYDQAATASFTFPRSLPLRLASNIAICFGLLWAVELSALLFSKLYQSLHVSRVMAENISTVHKEQPTASDAELKQKFARDNTLHNQMDGSPYAYSSYSVYANRPFGSETLNVDNDGYRITPHSRPAHPIDNEQPPFIIWVFGASPIFGATNTDDWTLPARLQKHMQDSTTREIHVQNFGVVGYNSWQALITLQKALMTGQRPDVVITFSTHSDHLLAWSTPQQSCSHLMYTAVGSSSALHRSWEKLSRREFLFLEDLVPLTKQQFPNIGELARLIWKTPQAILNRLFPEQIKTDYRRKRDAYEKNASDCLNSQINAFENNITLMAAASAKARAVFFAGTLPELSSTRKRLVGHELQEKYSKENYLFSLSDAELEKLPFLPNQRLSQVQFVPRQQYLDSLRDFESVLQQSAEAHNFKLINLENSVDTLADDFQLFSTSIHFTHAGADFLGQEIAKRIMDTLPQSRLLRP